MRVLHNIIVFCIFTVLSLMNFSCSSHFQSEQAKIPSPSTSFPTAILSSRTPIPNLLSPRTATPTPLLSSTPAQFPTLERTQANTKIIEWLQQGENCSSPCFWGIIPGKTSLGEAQNISNQLRHPLYEQTKDELYSTGFKIAQLETGIDLEIENQVVKTIRISFSRQTSKETTILQDVGAYSAKSLFDHYGPPSEISFYLSYPHEPNITPVDIAWYTMVLRFASQNLIVEYSYGVTKDAEFIQICPLSDQFSSIYVYLGRNPPNSLASGISLEKATSLTLDQFYNLIRQESETACFSLDRSAIPPS